LEFVICLFLGYCFLLLHHSMRHFLVFGAHPRLSLAEFRALKPSLPRPALVSRGAAVDDPDWDGKELMDRLGGTVKLGDVVKEVPVDQWSADCAADIIESHARADEIVFGWSVFGGSKSVRAELERAPLRIKRLLKERGRRCRWVTAGRSSSPSPAAVAKAGLTDKGYDFVLFISDRIIRIGLTTHVQNADAWSRRDYGRPCRDERAGMLPPKLARIMVNLARVDKGGVIIDPFCGSGTVLMEAALATDAGRIIGSDNDARQIASSKKNNAWLAKQGILKKTDADRFRVFVSDARTLGKRIKPESINAVVTEGSLGPPLRGSESKAALEKNRDEISALWNSSLKALRPLLKKGARLVIAWPSFKTAGGIARVSLDADVQALGYRIMNPLEGWEHANDPLVYHRPGQKAARRIVVLEPC
jgi:tRNA G10  N-methylase Trm11